MASHPKNELDYGIGKFTIGNKALLSSREGFQHSNNASFFNCFDIQWPPRVYGKKNIMMVALVHAHILIFTSHSSHDHGLFTNTPLILFQQSKGLHLAILILFWLSSCSYQCFFTDSRIEMKVRAKKLSKIKNWVNLTKNLDYIAVYNQY